MKIQLLYFEGCPHHRTARALIDSTLAELSLVAEVEELDVRDHGEAQEHRFLGSPSIRVDGADIEPGADARTAYGLSCRVYGTSPLPPRGLLRAALGVDR